MSDASDPEQDEEEHPTRLHLIWDVVIFQFKLAADGIRDIVLMPISLIAAIYGLIAGGHEPERYFKDVLRFGRRTEHWINLFGHRKGKGTADRMMEPMQQKVFEEVQKNPWIAKAVQTPEREAEVTVRRTPRERMRQRGKKPEESADE